MATITKQLNISLNRVEGDLEIRLDMDDDVVSDAWSIGTMYRGFENMMRGRGALDGLVITPRICGICGTAHLLAAVKALENAMDVVPPPNAQKLREVALLCENVQSDLRHGVLMFMVDFTNAKYKGLDLYEEACKRYEPFKGSTVIAAIQESKKILEAIAIIGGQWPHSSYMVPGGITTELHMSDINQCTYLIRNMRIWYERQMLGCSIERWQNIDSVAGLDAWLNERKEHSNSDVGFFIRFARQAGLDQIGNSYNNFISYGSSHSANKASTAVQEFSAGIVIGGEHQSFDPEQIQEHVIHSWYNNEDDGLNPKVGKTVPEQIGECEDKYSWVKSPRYNSHPFETGPLAEMVVAGIPLFKELTKEGPNTLVRELARLVRPVYTLTILEKLITSVEMKAPYYIPTPKPVTGEGMGLVEATRGALGHWISFNEGRIERYQIITPTAWNGSPRDHKGVRGPWEEAIVGTRIEDMDNPVEIGHIVRSFDACLVCAVHAIEGPNTLFKVNL